MLLTVNSMPRNAPRIALVPVIDGAYPLLWHRRASRSVPGDRSGERRRSPPRLRRSPLFGERLARGSELLPEDGHGCSDRIDAQDARDLHDLEDLVDRGTVVQ